MVNSLTEIPEVPQKLILDKLDFPAILSLHKTCIDYRNLIEDYKPGKSELQIQIDLKKESIDYKLSWPADPRSTKTMKMGWNDMVDLRNSILIGAKFKTFGINFQILEDDYKLLESEFGRNMTTPQPELSILAAWEWKFPEKKRNFVVFLGGNYLSVQPLNLFEDVEVIEINNQPNLPVGNLFR
ncbi:hypothetical protein L5515_009646 [Caenorhabditis briggsae]|uniref:F-box domain-containing protein n=1 Tax=Caenorhabditis briggsae TaxID=6238 RepID=A0AAE9JNZ4_CAEBR|nr:hypothetical protein L5515_009646 [Caenorhabditis briggsae]